MIGVGIPATTTSRGIGRVATLADMEPGATVENGPAVLDAKGGAITTTPTAYAVPQADEDGKLDTWVSDATNSVAGKTKKSDAVSSTGQDAATQKCAYATAEHVAAASLGAAIRLLQGGNVGSGNVGGDGGIGSYYAIGKTGSQAQLPAGGTWFTVTFGINDNGNVVLAATTVSVMPGGSVIGSGAAANVVGFAIRIA